jgi:hypothetical protein
MSHFSIYTVFYTYTVYAPCSLSYTLSPHPPPQTGTKNPDRVCSVLLFSDFVTKKNKKERENGIFVCLW